MDQTKYRWQVVRGPMAATIAVLRDLGWQAESPVFWRTGDSVLRLKDGDFPFQLWGALLKTCSAKSWRRSTSVVKAWKDELILPLRGAFCAGLLVTASA
eukprot:519932-Pyramimonas_sp.AAC.1